MKGAVWSYIFFLKDEFGIHVEDGSYNRKTVIRETS